MAYIDDNDHALPTGSGDDPIAAADKELAEIMRSLGRMDTASAPAGETASAPSADEGGVDKTADEPAPAEEAPQAQPRYTDQAAPQAAAPERPSPVYSGSAQYGAGQASDKGKSPKTLIIVIALIVAFIGIAAGAAVLLMSHRTAEPSENKAPGNETVTINDSELGTVEIRTVEGATVNTYSEENLVVDENGFYSYYENGRKVSEMGMDLCEFQGEIDFSAAKTAGIDFVMLRIGGRYYSAEGAMYSDSHFDTYYEQAKAAGLKVGAYFFSQATTAAEAEEEAAYALQLLNGRSLEYPIAFDWEIIDDDEARTDSVSGEVITQMAEAFCTKVRESGYKAIVYASTSLILQSYDFETMKDYEFWLADYREFPGRDKMYYDFRMWQYSTKGAVTGIGVPVDLNLCLKPY